MGSAVGGGSAAQISIKTWMPSLIANNVVQQNDQKRTSRSLRSLLQHLSRRIFRNLLSSYLLVQKQYLICHLSGYRKLQASIGTQSVKLKSVIYSFKRRTPTTVGGCWPLQILQESRWGPEPHRTLNSCKGVIRCSDLKGLTKDEIVDGLRSQGVMDCFHITVKSDNNNTDRRKTNKFILTFNTDTAAAHINVGYLRVKVDRYIPNPLRCFKCQKFGHSSRLCRNEAVCRRCDGKHTEENCNNAAKCINCSGPHGASSRCGSEKKKSRGWKRRRTSLSPKHGRLSSNSRAHFSVVGLPLRQ